MFSRSLHWGEGEEPRIIIVMILLLWWNYYCYDADIITIIVMILLLWWKYYYCYDADIIVMIMIQANDTYSLGRTKLYEIM